MHWGGYEHAEHAMIARQLEAAPLRVLAVDAFDVIVADLGLGPTSTLTGWDLAALASERCPDTRFVLATGWGPQIDPADARARGVDVIISKPFKLNELRDVVSGVR